VRVLVCRGGGWGWSRRGRGAGLGHGAVDATRRAAAWRAVGQGAGPTAPASRSRGKRCASGRPPRRT